MFTISPYFLTRVTKLPWTSTFHPVTTFLFCNWNSTLCIQTFCHMVRSNVRFNVMYFFIGQWVFCVFCQLSLRFLFLTLAIMPQILTLGAIRNSANITLDSLVLDTEFVERQNVSTDLFIFNLLSSIQDFLHLIVH